MQSVGVLLVMCSVGTAFHTGTQAPITCSYRAPVSDMASATRSSSMAAASGRRKAMLGAAALCGAALMGGAAVPELALASGGATAGKYTSIPIAKRRYFGRVKQGACLGFCVNSLCSAV